MDIQSAYQSQAYLLTALTNMHVGSGKSNYGIIDNLVQRDADDDLPCINSSSLKGALREYFENGIGADEKLVTHVFGSDTNASNGTGKNFPGYFRFLPGQLLSLPVRSRIRPFFNATSPYLIERFLDYCKLFGIALANFDALEAFSSLLSQGSTAIHFDAHAGQIELENLDIRAEKKSFDRLSEIKNILGPHPVLVNSEQLKNLCSNECLPVVARNHLENGISDNLWYEQILPRQSRFYSFLLHPKKGNGQFTAFNDHVKSQPVQIGANASIGYGLCMFQHLTN